MWLVGAAGIALCVYAALHLQSAKIDVYFLLLVIVTAAIGSRFAIPIPQINVNITVEDTFVFIGLLAYGGDAAIILGAIAGVCSSSRISKKLRTVAFGGGALACAVFVTSHVLQFTFGSPTNLFSKGYSAAFMAVCVMGLVQYLSHTGLGAIANALKDHQPLWRM